MVEVFSSSLTHHGTATSSIPEDSPVHDVSRVAAATVAARVLMGASIAAQPENKMMTREEHTAMMQELNRKRAGWRTPRRGWSSTDSPVLAGAPHPSQVPSTSHHNHYAVPQGDVVAPTQRQHRPLPDRSVPVQQQQQHAVRRPTQGPNPAPSPDQRTTHPRPAKPPPRRSYSVMDYEPPSPTHSLSSRMTITDLPAELHFAVFDFLDPIDSTCFGLTNKHFYAIHRRIHGSVPLSSRRDGPNDLEWAWRGAGPLIRPPPQAAAQLQKMTPLPAAEECPNSETENSSKSGPAADVEETTAEGTTPKVTLQRASTMPPTPISSSTNGGGKVLETLRVKGQVYCRKCGISRCELHRHLREWMMASTAAAAGGEERPYEYCSVTCKYGPSAGEGAKEFCYLRSPKRPHRCGRHGGVVGRAC